jgi:hypothetical protein
LKKLYCVKNPLFFIEPIPKMPVCFTVPDNLNFLLSKNDYCKYYGNYVTFSTNFHTFKNLLLSKLGYPSLEVSDKIKSRYYVSLGSNVCVINFTQRVKSYLE